MIAESVPNSPIQSRVQIGRTDHHLDNDQWPDETSSYVSHILVDYTNAVFPLLPDISSDIKNPSYKNHSINSETLICQELSRGKQVIYIKTTSSNLTVGNKLKIFSLTGKVIDELELKDGKFIWNTLSVSNGTYLLHCKGTKNNLNQRLVLIQ